MRCLLLGNYTTYASHTIVRNIGALSTRLAEQLFLHKYTIMSIIKQCVCIHVYVQH